MDPHHAPAYTLRFERHPTHLYAFVTGPEDNVDISNRYWMDIATECLRLGYRRLLVEEDFPHALSDTEMFLHISDAPRELLTLRIAFVDRQADHNNLLGETLARSLGADAKVFADREDAERWLLADL
jgi:hypothetical protein